MKGLPVHDLVIIMVVYTLYLSIIHSHNYLRRKKKLIFIIVFHNLHE